MQVFALESDAAVRTRLTHSLEVAHVGTYVVEMVFKHLDKQAAKSDLLNEWRSLTREERLAVRTFVEVACLVHDIGNPPFGHFGEKAICNWFSAQDSDFKNRIVGSRKSLYNDLEGFDGNKQGFRILTSLQRNLSDGFGLNLTYTQLAATIKYPISTGPKGSIFESERPIKDEIWKRLGLRAEAKHPLAFLMEAADDIAYCVSDIEDASDKQLVESSDLDIAFQDDGRNRDDPNKRFTIGRTNLTNKLVDEAARAFVGRLKKIRPKEFGLKGSLLDDDRGDLRRLKEIANKRIYSSRIVLSNEATGFAVVQGLLDTFAKLLDMESSDFRALCKKFLTRASIYEADTKSIARALTAEPALISLLPRKYIAHYLEADQSRGFPEPFLRAHLLVDFISGMTDEYALNTFRLVSGQRTYVPTS